MMLQRGTMRKTSIHNVAVLDTEKFKKEFFKELRDGGKVTDNQDIRTEHYGIVEKDGKHYLINTEGIGSIVALEDEPGEIYWWRETHNEDGHDSFECGPFVKVSYNYYRMIKEFPIKEVVTLDKFVRTFGSRLDENVEAWDEFLSGNLIPE